MSSQWARDRFRVAQRYNSSNVGFSSSDARQTKLDRQLLGVA
jgi:hypothetical protein